MLSICCFMGISCSVIVIIHSVIFTMKFFTGIFRNALSKPHMLSLTECVWEFQNNALWDTHQHDLLHPLNWMITPHIHVIPVLHFTKLILFIFCHFNWKYADSLLSLTHNSLLYQFISVLVKHCYSKPIKNVLDIKLQ